MRVNACYESRFWGPARFLRDSDYLVSNARAIRLVDDLCGVFCNFDDRWHQV